MRFEMIAFDADDTLWESEQYYHAAQVAFSELLAAYDVQRDSALNILHQIEMENLPVFGYGIRGFTISMVEAAIQATGGRLRAQEIQKLIDLGRAMTRHPIRLLSHAAETTARLAQTHPLVVITKGDHVDQERKIHASGLARHFQAVEIVTGKTMEIYAALLARHGVNPQRFLMVGNAMRSDILPVLALGGWAVYVPHPLTWAHESGQLDTPSPRFFEIAHLELLPGLIQKIEQDMLAN